MAQMFYGGSGKFCKGCTYYRRDNTKSHSGNDRCLWNDEDGTKQRVAVLMRESDAECGPSADLFKPVDDKQK